MFVRNYDENKLMGYNNSLKSIMNGYHKIESHNKNLIN